MIAAQEWQRIGFDELRALYDQPGPVVTPLLRRGDALTPGPPVEPGVLSSLTTLIAFQWTPPAAEAKTSGRRLAFARWLTQPDPPLTARVMVNRIWLHHFGEGLVSTPEDFGTLGSAPSHPQLLDWLAREFVESGWSIKQIHRRVMISSAYRQSSHRLADERRVRQKSKSSAHSSCRSPNSSANHGLADGTRSVPATFVGHVMKVLIQSAGRR